MVMSAIVLRLCIYAHVDSPFIMQRQFTVCMMSVYYTRHKD